jgi:hypothetical protein
MVRPTQNPDVKGWLGTLNFSSERFGANLLHQYTTASLGV